MPMAGLMGGVAPMVQWRRDRWLATDDEWRRELFRTGTLEVDRSKSFVSVQCFVDSTIRYSSARIQKSLGRTANGNIFRREQRY